MTSDIIYNSRSEVVSASISNTVASYAYDNIGNNQWTAVNGTTNTYTANSLNQYSQISVPSVPSVENLSYDLDGNLLTNGIFSYTYDAENRLTTALSNNICVVSNAYDYMNRRVIKVTPTATHTFIYDGWNLIQETIDNHQSTITNHFVWGKDLSGTMQGAGGVGGLLAVSIENAWFFPFYDANGDITAYVDVNGSVVAEYTYNAFGETIAQSGSMFDTFRHRFSTRLTGCYPRRSQSRRKPPGEEPQSILRSLQTQNVDPHLDVKLPQRGLADQSSLVCDQPNRQHLL